MMEKKYVVAFDQGTTSTRTIIFNKEGEIVAVAQKELTQHYPKSGWVEHNPEEIYQDQLYTFKEAIIIPASSTCASVNSVLSPASARIMFLSLTRKSFALSEIVSPSTTKLPVTLKSPPTSSVYAGESL